MTMRRQLRPAALALAAALVQSASAATTWYVATDGKDDGTNDGKSPSAPFATLQKAADSCSSGDAVVFAAGTYPFTSCVTSAVHYLTVRSQSLDPADVVFDGRGQTGFLKLTGEGARLLGVTFRNALCDGAPAVYVKSAYGVVSNCVFRNNRRVTKRADGWISDNEGGALFFRGVGTKAWDCLFEGNSMTVAQGSGGTTEDAARGGGGAFFSVALSGCVFRGNAVTNDSDKAYTTLCAGGGAYLNGCTATNCTFDGNAAVNPRANGTIGFGGGAYLAGGSVLSDSLVVNNEASCAGGGVALDASRLSACTVSNNCVKTVQSKSYNMGGGAFLFKSSEMANCHVVSNAIVGTVAYHGGGFAVCAAFDSKVLDCLVEGNSGKGAAVTFSTYSTSANAAVVSNCVIRGNLSVGTGVFHTYPESNSADKPPSALVTDCWVVSNSCSGAGNNSALLNFSSYLTGFTANVLTFRNCLFHGNGAVAGETVKAAFYSTYDKSDGILPVSLEQCTFVDNAYGAGNGYFFRESKTSGATDFSVKGCVFVRAGGQGVFSEGELLALSANVSNSYFSATAILESMAGCGNLTAGGEGVDAKFADEAGGDCRPLAGSSLIDAGPAAQAWMGVGRRKGPQDLGDGTFTVGRVGTYGVTVTRNGPHPRLAGAAPDIGCFEFWTPPGALLLVR